MGEKTGIAWTDSTWNLAWGCVEASAGCDHCYARTQSARYGFDVWGVNKPRRVFGEKHWNEPRKWNRAAEAAGVRKRVFTSSMTDVFLNDPMIDEERQKLWPLIRETPWLDWQILTKHPERIVANLPDDWGSGYPNAWLGVTVENAAASWRAAMLVGIPAVVHFLSVEPMIGAVPTVELAGIQWVIIGGESGSGHRPLVHNWARDLVTRCEAMGVPVFFKQDSGFRSGVPGPADLMAYRQFPAPGQIVDAMA